MGVRIPVTKVELVKESAKVYDYESKFIRSPMDAEWIARDVMRVHAMAEENFFILSLNTKNAVISFTNISKGALSSSVVHPREVFKPAILANAASIVCFHNHPSGDPTPSREDIKVTERLKEAGKLLGIEVLDHIVLGGPKRSVSLKEEGYL